MIRFLCGVSDGTGVALEGDSSAVMQHLVSVSVIGSRDDMTDESLSSAVHQEMSHWFGDEQTADWKLLKVYRVSFAQPNQVIMHSLLVVSTPTHQMSRAKAHWVHDALRNESRNR